MYVRHDQASKCTYRYTLYTIGAIPEKFLRCTCAGDAHVIVGGQVTISGPLSMMIPVEVMNFRLGNVPGSSLTINTVPL